MQIYLLSIVSIVQMIISNIRVSISAEYQNPCVPEILGFISN